jgi:KDO2-lipid IV(A) lauroyltransferase
VEYVAVLVLYGFLAVLPRRVRLGLGRALGRFIFRIDRRHRDIALFNLAMAYPGATGAWREEVARRSFANLGRLLVEVLMLRRDADEAMAEDDVEGWEHVESLARSHTGYFLMSGHFGNWERAAFAHGARGMPLWMVTRPLDNPYLEGLLAGIRAATGNRIIHKRSGIKETVKGLRGGHAVAFVIDQDFPEAGPHFVPFFGKLASTTPALGTLATRLGAPVLPIFAYPKPAGGYHVVYGPLVPADGMDNDEAGAKAMTEAATARIEEAVRRCPEAWFWMHHRWRTRPLDEPLDGSALTARA